MMLPENERHQCISSIGLYHENHQKLILSVIPMLPPILCEHLCSLNPGVDRFAFSVVWEMTPEGKIVSEWFGRTVINSAGKLAYEHAQKVIENYEAGVEELRQVVGKNIQAEDVAKDILLLNDIASKYNFTLF